MGLLTLLLLPLAVLFLGVGVLVGGKAGHILVIFGVVFAAFEALLILTGSPANV